MVTAEGLNHHITRSVIHPLPFHRESASASPVIASLCCPLNTTQRGSTRQIVVHLNSGHLLSFPNKHSSLARPSTRLIHREPSKRPTFLPLYGYITTSLSLSLPPPSSSYSTQPLLCSRALATTTTLTSLTPAISVTVIDSLLCFGREHQPDLDSVLISGKPHQGMYFVKLWLLFLFPRRCVVQLLAHSRLHQDQNQVLRSAQLGGIYCFSLHNFSPNSNLHTSTAVSKT